METAVTGRSVLSHSDSRGGQWLAALCSAAEAEKCQRLSTGARGQPRPEAATRPGCSRLREGSGAARSDDDSDGRRLSNVWSRRTWKGASAMATQQRRGPKTTQTRASAKMIQQRRDPKATQQWWRLTAQDGSTGRLRRRPGGPSSAAQARGGGSTAVGTMASTAEVLAGGLGDAARVLLWVISVS